MASNTVTTTGSSITSCNTSLSSNQDLTIDVGSSGVQNSCIVVPNNPNPMVLHHCSQRTSEAPTGSRVGNPEPSIRLRLQERELWQEFYAVGNEMIVTKPGRRMYPYVVVTPNGLKPGMQYVVGLRIVPVDNKRYKYTNGLWHAVGGSDAIMDSSRMSFKHPTTPALGEHLNGKPLIFKHAKLTHIRDNKEHILVRTMHKYMAVIDVSEVGETVTKTTTFLFMETTFIAVTSYLSSQLTSLKIRHNPFARGIQDRAQMSITNGGDSDYTDEDEDNILPPILSGNPRNIPIPYLPMVHLPPDQSASTSASYALPPPLLPTLSVPQIFSYTSSASSHSQPSSCIFTPSLPPQESSCIPASNYISTFTLPHHPQLLPTPPPPPPAGLPFLPPPVSSYSQDPNAPSGSGLCRNSTFLARLPRWSGCLQRNSSAMATTSYITTPSGRHHFYSQVSWPYPYPPIPPRHTLPRLPSTQSFQMTPFPHPYIPYPSSAAPYYPSTTIAYPLYYNTTSTTPLYRPPHPQ